MKKFAIFVTDAYQGEPNYCWIRRYLVSAKSLKSALTKAKRHYYGVPCPRHKLSEYGEGLRADIVGYCVVFFVDRTDSNDDLSQYVEI